MKCWILWSQLSSPNLWPRFHATPVSFPKILNQLGFICQLESDKYNQLYCIFYSDDMIVMFIGNRIGISGGLCFSKSVTSEAECETFVCLFLRMKSPVEFFAILFKVYMRVYRSFIELGVCIYQSKVRDNFSLLPFQFSVAHFFQRASNDFIVLQAAASIS